MDIENKVQRIVWLDVAKYICIIMVMLSHLETRTDLWYVFYTPFFLSVFFFVSGYVYKPKDDVKGFFYKKFRQLFVPWLVFSVFDILLSQIYSFNEHAGLWIELKWNFLQIRGLGDGLWFVAALFVAFIPFYFFINWYENKLPRLIGGGDNRCVVALLISWFLSLISVLYARLMPADMLPWNESELPWHIEYIFQAMFYMVLGYMFRHYAEEWLDECNTAGNRIIICLIYLLIVYAPYFKGMEMPMLIDIFYNYMEALVGITAVVMVSKVIKTNCYINYAGQNTLIYFALHGKVYSVIQTIFKKFAGEFYMVILNSVIASSVFALAFSLLLSVLLIVPAYIINRWFPFIMGRAKKSYHKKE